MLGVIGKYYPIFMLNLVKFQADLKADVLLVWIKRSTTVNFVGAFCRLTMF